MPTYPTNSSRTGTPDQVDFPGISPAATRRTGNDTRRNSNDTHQNFGMFRRLPQRLIVAWRKIRSTERSGIAIQVLRIGISEETLQTFNPILIGRSHKAVMLSNG